MATKRKSAFSVYKMQKKIADENSKSNAEVQESGEIETSDSFPGGKKGKLFDTSTESNNNDKSKKQRLSRASKLRHSIGNIGLNKKRKNKKKKLSESGSISETDSDKNNEKADESVIKMTPGIVKTKELKSTGFVHKVTSLTNIAELPNKTFEWLISPVTTDKFFRYSA